MNAAKFHWTMFKMKHLRGFWEGTIRGKQFQLTIGPDMNNSHAGLTWRFDEIEPCGDWRRWRTEFRLNFHWPISVRLR